MRIFPRVLLLALACGTTAAGAIAPPEAVPSAVSAGSCPNPAGWTMLEGERMRAGSTTAVFSEMASRDIVLLGERHDDDDHHRWQLQALAALHALRPDMVLGFEMFPRRVQPVLDRWVAGELSVGEFLAQAEWARVWSMPAELYLPLFQFARINRIPMVALNVDRALVKDINERGWDGVPEAEREGVGRPAPPPAAYRDFLFDIYRQHASMHGAEGEVAQSDPAFVHFVDSQTAWDRAMAEALASRVAQRGTAKPLVVGIMGSGHIRFGYGVPYQLRELGVSNVGTLMPVNAGAECDEVRPGLADAVFALPKQATSAPLPPRLGVSLEESNGEVRVADVSAGSLAERTGLRSGDRLIEVAGMPATKLMPVIASIERQPEGTWLPLRVRRGDETLDLVVKFPATP